MFDEIVSLINEIGKLHQDFSHNFFKGHIAYNLKRTRVDKVLQETSYDETFISLVDDYIEELSYWLIFLEFNSKSLILETRFRGKNKESALNKLYYYRVGKSDPTIPVQKCLNDLLGFRIIINNTIDYDCLLDKIKRSDKLNIKLFRPYVRTDENYKGIHLYVKSDNNHYFPWEIQIWQKSDEISNERSHRNHKEKRQYINWTEIYKEYQRKE
ncbi:hypothetical protein [Streptococcus tangpeifui]|uniref:hypothetical protein n=1 Tax=Streptococcus tangpeifui TaxID=2709400 RepID=UPI0013EB2958|nr:hypothetical protein [Streptococcus sp. ZJ373]